MESGNPLCHQLIERIDVPPMPQSLTEALRHGWTVKDADDIYADDGARRKSGRLYLQKETFDLVVDFTGTFEFGKPRLPSEECAARF